jgi:methylphosphotriester-DNA--protein-cysteine methyltransferase
MAERLFLRLHGDPPAAPETDAPPTALREFAPGPALAGVAGALLHYRERFDDGVTLVERVLPDGAMRLVFHRDAAGRWTGLAVGATVQPALVQLSGDVDGWSVTLEPGASAALLGLPAAELTGQAVPLEDLWHGQARALFDGLAGARDDVARAVLLRAALSRQVARRRNAPASAAARAACALLQRAGGRLSPRQLASQLGFGERRLQQIFQAEIGLTPKAVARLARLHALLRALRAVRAPRWAELALDAGYCDQAHLANEFHALCGLTPGEFRARLSGSSKTAAAATA